MKKQLLVLACFALVSIAAKAQFGQIVLQHDGVVSVFENNKMDDAMAKAVDGDVIYLSEGTFSGDMNITKKVSIIGAGINTVWGGNVNIDIPGTPTLTNRLLDAFTISNTITVKQPCKGLNIRKCTFNAIRFNALTESATIDRCYCRGGEKNGFFLSENVKALYVMNSKIWYLWGNAEAAGDVNFMNCNINFIYNYYYTNGKYQCVLASYTNCIIRTWDETGSNYQYTNTVYRNCLCGTSSFSSSNAANCWNFNNTNSGVLLSSNAGTGLTDADLKSKGYIGTDGTVVGITGGAAPFSLTPTVPRVTEHTINVDTDKKELNVNIKVTTN